jgi:hypothetical protein
MQLTPEQLEQIKARKALINQQELIVNGLKLELIEYIKKECGVDVTNEGYVVDIEKGELTRAN